MFTPEATWAPQSWIFHSRKSYRTGNNDCRQRSRLDLMRPIHDKQWTKTRWLAVAEGLRDALYQFKSYQLLYVRTRHHIWKCVQYVNAVECTQGDGK